MHKPQAFPWYDSLWLGAYVQAKNILSEYHPEKLDDFISAMRAFKTDPTFREVAVNSILSNKTLMQVRSIISDIDPSLYQKHEFLQFGRMVIHDHPEFDVLQRELCGLVEDVVGERVEPSYNFLSLYNNLGNCEPHMDAPLAKWTLDICIDQSATWPIYFSDVMPWPESFISTEDWQSKITNNPKRPFREYTLKPNDAIIFGGSSQWHYRNRIEQRFKQNFCHLLFMHFIPLGTKELVNPNNWASIFSVPELANIDYAKKPEKPTHDSTKAKT